MGAAAAVLLWVTGRVTLGLHNELATLLTLAAGHSAVCHCCRYAEFSGFHGILAALLVAVKQIMPQQEVILGGAIRLSARVRSLRVHAWCHVTLGGRSSTHKAPCWWPGSCSVRVL